ncbi:structural maintenance of chromosomes protein 2 isoform X1 [Lampetra planeri]
MYIKSIVVDGFKSYAQRTEISDWDPLFNAITGLNGSGKSNILDAVCFVLGISNLSQVRAASLQELVYKNGQAGVTKATVSITFDNRDRKQSPLGFEGHAEITVTRQVVIGGRNKYLINGVNATTARVQDLFRSVGLNVNNPHFLIMQGRITKVLNMKPPEILAMIEEAAGTRMYESKKLAAQKTIEKKEAKLKEINDVLDEEISPTLEKLKQERTSYLEYSKLCRELDSLRRLVIAHQFSTASQGQENAALHLQKLRTDEQEAREEVERLEEEEKKREGELREMERERDKEAGGDLSCVEEALTQAQRAHAKAQSTLDIRTEALATEQAHREQLLANMQEDASARDAKRSQVVALEAALASALACSQEAARGLQEAQARFAAASVGLSEDGQGGHAATLAEQILKCRQEASQAQTEAAQAQMKLSHVQRELQQRKAEEGRTTEAYTRDQQALSRLKTRAQGLLRDMAALGYTEGQLEMLQKNMKELAAEESAMREKVDRAVASMPQLQFDYRDPERGWDRGRVRGLVASLLRVEDPASATALEVVAGGKLYNVVTDTELTGKLLLERGCLRRRVTVIPLNKISPSVTPPSVSTIARSLADGVSPALSLVSPRSPCDLPALEFVFGAAFVCPTMDSARAVAFDPRVSTRAVTLDGDSFSPHGTLTGGARAQVGHSPPPRLPPRSHHYYHHSPRGQRRWMEASSARTARTRVGARAQVGRSPPPHSLLSPPRSPSPLGVQVVSVLVRVEQLLTLQDKLKELEEKGKRMDEEARTLTKLAERHRELRQQQELVAQEVEQLQQKLELSTHHKLQTELAALATSIEELSAAPALCEERRAAALQRLHSLEERLQNAERDRRHEQEGASSALELARGTAQKLAGIAREAQQSLSTVRLEVEELEKEALVGQQELQRLEAATLSLEETVRELSASAESLQARVSECQRHVTELQEVLRARQEALGEAARALEQLRARRGAAALTLTERGHAVGRHQRDALDNAAKVDRLLKENAWISTERALFGRPNTAYDFAASDPSDAARRLSRLEQTRQRMVHTVNERAMNLLAQSEEKYVDLMKKKRIVENDKTKIFSAMQELDLKKNEALNLAWRQVNGDFSSIFSTLLPGSQARLTPVESSSSSNSSTSSLLQGLEFRVALGSVWKENLSELSGGQRSLVALSLILAMLLFKPAPIYILDEVDAALDLSHTQNIGHMLRTHFLTSQFVVVSLKDGMFNNANVLFKTRFIEGVSTVTRHTNATTTSRPAAPSSSSTKGRGEGEEKKAKRGRLGDE